MSKSIIKPKDKDIELATISNNNLSVPVIKEGFAETLIEPKETIAVTSSINKNLCPTIYFYGERMTNEKLFIPSQFPNLTKYNVKNKIDKNVKKVTFTDVDNKKTDKIEKISKRNKENKKNSVKKALKTNKTRKL
jgi:hypothetical protein